MIRQEAQDADEQDQVDGPRGLLLVNAASGVGDPLGNERVADEDDGKRDDKAEQQGTDIVGHHAMGPAGRREVLKARSRVPWALVVKGPPKDKWDRDAYSNEPKACDHYPVVGDFDPDVGEGVQHGHVTIHANAGEEGNADVDVDVVQGPGYPTSHVSKDPIVLVQVVMDFKGQHANKQGICYSQVDEVDVGVRAVLDLAGQKVESQDIF